jgi:TolB-like protein/DNA-binding winged helix-turn-helix (wHTH) protein/tetratricopeptide (TPR) repeat protein
MNAVPADRRNGDFRVGEWLVRPSLDHLSRGGTVIHVRPKVMDVLVYLAAHGGEVVSKDEVIEAVWAKQFLADSALSRAVCELREVLGDEPRSPTYIQTISKRGYRLVAPLVPAEPVTEPTDRPLPLAPPRASGKGSPRRFALAGLSVSLFLLTAWVTGHEARSTHGATPPPPKTIVVLPFENLGGGEDGYLAAGITDQVAGRLTTVHQLSVISHVSAARLATLGRNTRDTGQALGADYVLTGTVRWDRNPQGRGHVRITPRLIRVADDTQVWAEVYDRGIEDILRVQSDIARSVVTEIGIALAGPQRPAPEQDPTSSLEAYQAYLRGIHYMRLPEPSVSDVQLALQMYERAVALDPEFALAHAGVGQAHSLLYHYGLRTVGDHRVRAREAFDRALALAPDDPDVHLFYAVYLYWCHRTYDAALSELAVARRALRGSPYPWEIAGLVLRRRGDWEASVDAFQKSSRLNPGDALTLHHAGVTLGLMRRYEEAQGSFDKAIALAPDELPNYTAKAENLWRWRADLPGARAVLESAPTANSVPVAHAWYWQEVYEGRYAEAIDRLLRLSQQAAVLSDLQRPKVLLLALAQGLAGDHHAARKSYQTALTALDEHLRTNPDNAYLHAFRAIALAGLGRIPDTMREGETAIALCPTSSDAVDGVEVLEAVAESYTMAGKLDRALDCLDRLLSLPSWVSVPMLALDPRWAPLRNHPRFQTLVEKYGSTNKSDTWAGVAPTGSPPRS